MYVADMHCDTISKIYYSRKEKKQTGLYENEFQVDLQRMKQGNYMLQNFAVFVDMGKEAHPYQCAKEQIAIFQEEINKNQEWIGQIRTAEDIEENCKAGKISALLTLEEGDICEGSLEKLEEFYRAGVRMMTFTWNYDNLLGNGEGLTEQGVAFLEKMESLGMLPDVSHLSEAGFYDVCRYGRKPFVASHSNAAALCGHKRNLKDDMIQKIAERGGVIGVNYYGLFLSDEPENGFYYSRVSRIAEHILHLIHVGGISCVGLGSDFDGIDDNLELQDCSKMELLEWELKKKGLKESEIESVFYKNVLNLYREVF